jgi:hypothetical protein
MKSKLVLAVMTAILVACGGSDDAGSSNDPVVSGPPPPAGSRVHRYEAFTSPTASAAFLSLLNAEGAQGYRFFSDMLFVAGGTSQSVFVNDSTATYSYELLVAAATPQAFITQANAQGARGFRFAGVDSRGVIYRKVDNSTETFVYVSETAPAVNSRTSSGYLTAVNAQGAAGYRQVGDLVLDRTPVYIYEKSSAGTPVYRHEVMAVPATDAAVLAQFDAQGARGYRMKTIYSFGQEGLRFIYEADTSQNASFRYNIAAKVSSTEAMVTQANAEGTSGRGYIGDIGLPSGNFRTLYFTAYNCTGVLCDVRGLLGH